MLRKLAVFMIGFAVLAATHARALGLGDITLESALNQPLAARIELLQAEGLSAAEIRVQMASADDFERFSLDRPYFLDAVRFDVETGGGAAYIRLSSIEPVREPYLSFVLDTRWPRGRVLTEYTVLLDPPAFASRAATQAPQPPVRSVDDRAAGNVPDDDMPSAPEAVPAAAAQAAATAGPAPESGAAAAGGTARFADTAETIEVGADDTLWDIALRVRPDDSVSVQQTMVALQRLNPEAFVNGNINLVQRGAVLRVPDPEQMRQLGRAEAISEVARQNRLFEDRRNVPLASEPLAPPPEAATGGAGGDAELSVVSIEGDEAEQTTQQADAAAGELRQMDERIEAVEERLAVSREELDRVERQNRELTGRLAMLEEQIESAREIIRLRDLELAQLQESLSNGAAEPPAGAEPDQQSPPPPAVTMAPEPSLPERIVNIMLGNPMILGGLLALIVALLVLLLIRRNNAKQAEMADGQHGEEEDEELDFSTVGKATAGASSTTDAHQAAGPVTDERYEDDEELFEELRSFTGQGEHAMVSEELDELMAEVDAMLEHNQYDEARRLLENAIVADPNQQALRIRLLEVLADQKDVEGFRLQESQLAMPINTAMQNQLQRLRQRIAAVEASAGGAAVAAAEPEQVAEEDELELALDMESSADVDDEKVRRGGDIGESGAGDQGAGRDEAQDEGQDESQEEELEFEFDLDLDEPLTEPEAVAAATEAGMLEVAVETSEEESESARGTSSEQAQKQKKAEEEYPEADEDFEFDFDLEPDEEQAPGGEETRRETEIADVAREPESGTGSDDTAEEFEFSLDDFELDADERQSEGRTADEAVGPAGPVNPDAEDQAARSYDDLELDDLELSELDTTPEGQPAPATERQGATASGARNRVSEEEDFDFLSDTDEAATKLDLARAYIDMDDAEGAREILEEVLAEGNEVQQEDARNLLGRLE